MAINITNKRIAKDPEPTKLPVTKAKTKKKKKYVRKKKSLVGDSE